MVEALMVEARIVSSIITNQKSYNCKILDFPGVNKIDTDSSGIITTRGVGETSHFGRTDNR
eukprot:scaffold57136_cov47-Attheya_sp.AAC.1